MVSLLLLQPYKPVATQSMITSQLPFTDFYKLYDFSPIEYLREHEAQFFNRLASDLKQGSSLLLKMLADDEATCRFPDDGRLPCA